MKFLPEISQLHRSFNSISDKWPICDLRICVSSVALKYEWEFVFISVRNLDSSTNITLLPCGEVSSNVLFSYIQYLPDNVSKDSHTLSSAFIPGAHKDTFSHCLRCGMSCLLCLSNNSLTMFSHPKGNGCCLTQTFSCWFNNSLERTASSLTIGQWWQRLKVALFIIFACVPESPGSLQSTPVSLFYQLPCQHCLQGHQTRLGWHKEDMWSTNVFLETAQ